MNIKGKIISKKYKELKKCWFCGEKPRMNENTWFCKKCYYLKNREFDTRPEVENYYMKL